MLGVKGQNDNAYRPETALYAPVKEFLENRGYEVKGEVRGCARRAYRSSLVFESAHAWCSLQVGAEPSGVEIKARVVLVRLSEAAAPNP